MLVIGAAASLAAGSGRAEAVIVLPQVGVVATESVVGGGRSYTDPNYPYGFHATGGIGEPGYPNPNYNPKGYFGTTQSASTAYDREISGDGKHTALVTGGAAADLASGQLHVESNAARDGSGVDGTVIANISANAVMSDKIFITGTISKPVTVRLNLVIDGGFSSSGPGGSGPDDTANTIAAFELSVGGRAYAEVFLNKFVGGSIEIQDQSSDGGHLSVQSGTASALQLTLSEDVLVTDSSRAIGLEAIAQVSVYPTSGTGTLKGGFGNTARLTLDLPDGLGFTSLSGVLLTVPQDVTGGGGTTSVPEPGSLVLLAAAGLATLDRRRHRDGSRRRRAAFLRAVSSI